MSILILLLTSPYSNAEDRYNKIGANENFVYYFDTASMKHVPQNKQLDFIKNPTEILSDGGYIEVWIKLEYTPKGIQDVIERRSKSKLPVEGYEQLSYTLDHWMIKTKDSEYLYLGSVDYGTGGKMLVQYNVPFQLRQWESVIPGSVGEDIHGAVILYQIRWYYKFNDLLKKGG